MLPATVLDMRAFGRRRALMLLLITACLLSSPVAAGPARQAVGSDSLVINEIDYMQPGGDTAEFVELLNVGEAPVDLGAHALLAIDRLGETYRRVTLPDFPLLPGEYFVICGQLGQVPNCDLALSLRSGLLQDSVSAIPPNAVALVREAAGRTEPETLVDSVSYEGDVPGGPPAGGSWTEGKGVDPGDDASVAYLGISRAPGGVDTDVNSTDFQRRCITPGAINSKRGTGCIAPLVLAGLVVNEIDYIQSGRSDDAEFVEIKNTGDRALDLGRYAVLGLDSSGDEYRRIGLPPLRLPPGDYYVLCGLTDRVPNCDLAVMEPSVDVWLDYNTFEGPAAVALVKAGQQGSLDILVDSVSHDGEVKGGPMTGGAWTETSGVTPGDNNDVQHLGISRLPDGFDSNDNSADLSPRCITPGRENDSSRDKCPAASPVRDLVINEVDYSQPGDIDQAEFVELRNIGSGPLDLAGYVLLGVDMNSRIYRTIQLPSRVLAPGAYYVVCNPVDPEPKVPNCDLPIGPSGDAWQDVFTSQSAFNAIALLYDPTSDPRDNVLVDSLAYDGFVEGGPATGRGWTEGGPVSPGDEKTTDDLSISRLPDGVDTDANPADFGQSCSSPGYENLARPAGARCPPASRFTPTPEPTATPSATATDRPTATATGTRPGDTPTPSPTATRSGGGLDRIVVSDSGDLSDVNPEDGICRTALGSCSLRAAIETANADTGDQDITIVFDLRGEIAVPQARALPGLERAKVIIDGSSGAGPFLAPGRRSPGPAGLAQSGCLAAQVLRGAGRGTGLSLNGPGQGVQGMQIHGFDIGIELAGAASGVRIGSDGDGSRDAEECNAIWDNREAQLRITGDGASANRVAGNLIGVDPSGGASLISRDAVGIDIAEGASSNVIGVNLSRSGAVLGLGNVIQNNRVGLRIGGAGVGGGGSADNRIMGNRVGDLDRASWEARANLVGIQLAAGATGTWIGGPRDGDPPTALANRVAHNLAAGIIVERGVTDTSIRANDIVNNRRDGIRIAQTREGSNTLRGNRITENGGAAIMVESLGAQLPPPTIDWVDVAGDMAGGTGCAGCIVELFADATNEAGLPLARGTVDPSGSWAMSGLQLWRLSVPHLTATITDAEGNTSRLSAARALGASWVLVEVPPPLPRVLRRGQRVVERSYRLLDDKGQRVAGAEIRFSPIELRFLTDSRGLVQIEIPSAEALRSSLRSSSFSVEAIDQGGRAHPVAWYPQLAMARAEPSPAIGDVILDLSGLGSDGIGGLLRRSSGVGPFFGADLSSALPALSSGRLWPSLRGAAPRSPAQGESDAYGAAFAAAPTTELREGQYAWQENLARGGGIYELEAGEGSTLSGELEIVAPVEAYDSGRPASACSADPQGAVIAGWNHDERCWVPMPGMTVDAPPEGASSFTARGEITIEATGFVVQSALQATTAITLYTVGFDTRPPELSLTLSAGSRVSQLPAVLARVDEPLAGVKAASGLAVTLAGVTVPASYDMESGEIRVAAEDRALPPGLTGAAELVVQVSDGFCNSATESVSLVLDLDAPPPDDGRTLYIPSLLQKRQ